MIKKGDVIIVADDDEVRIGASQNPAIETLSSEEFFLSTKYIQYCSPIILPEKCGGGYRHSMLHI
jgi:hypothetical protein